MAKLYFRYGAVGSAKTLNLLAVVHNYRQQGKGVLLAKPKLDDRFGEVSVKSRAGLEATADILFEDDTLIPSSVLAGVACIVVDEAQFLTPKNVEYLRYLTIHRNIPVICYGLRTDFRTRVFPGSLRLLELADAIEEVKSTCSFCDRKATVNLKHSGGHALLEGPPVELGAEERYLPACYSCYAHAVQLSTAPSAPVQLLS
jgi:thymidine kinase